MRTLAGAPGVRSRMVGFAAGLVAIMAFSLAASYAWFVPLRTDGGWYSYPGYALSQGRDPSENLLPLSQIATRQVSGVSAVFRWENRSHLVVRLHQAWFTLFGTTILSLKVFGAIQWLGVATVVGWAIWLACGSRPAAVAGAIAALSDSWLIAAALADLRPDVPIALVACLCLLAITRYQRGGMTAWLFLAYVLAVALPLLHFTGILALVFCGVFASTLAGLSASDGPRKRLAMVGIGLAGGLAFFFRQRLLDSMIPTSLPPELESTFRPDLGLKLRQIVAHGVLDKMLVEAGRWSDYFLLSNAVHSVFIGVGLSCLAVRATGVGTQATRLRYALLAAFAASVIATLADPHATVSHLIPIAALAYVAAGVGLVSLSRTRSERAALATALLCILAAAVKGSHALAVARAGLATQVSNAALASFVSKHLDTRDSRVVIAPTLLWPYVDASRSVVLVDPGARSWSLTDERWQFVSALALDEDILGRNWRALTAALVSCGSITRVASFGRRGSVFYLEVFRLARAPSVCAEPKRPVAKDAEMSEGGVAFPVRKTNGAAKRQEGEIDLRFAGPLTAELPCETGALNREGELVADRQARRSRVKGTAPPAPRRRQAARAARHPHVRAPVPERAQAGCT